MRTFIIAAYAIPVMVIGRFSMLAIIPLAIIITIAIRNSRLHALRWYVAALTAVYATPLALWAIGPDRAPSLSKDMHPVFVPLISAAAVALIVAFHVTQRRRTAVASSATP